MKKLTIRIPITPKAWQRPKTRVVGKFVKHYSPAQTQNYEKEIAQFFKAYAKDVFFEREEPICVNIVFGMPIPVSTPKSKKDKMLEGILQHTKRPDLDNLLKAVLDALNGVAWEDDSQIVRISAMKEYSEKPYIYIYMHEYID